MARVPRGQLGPNPQPGPDPQLGGDAQRELQRVTRELERLATKIVASELRAMFSRVQERLAGAGLDVEHFESSRERPEDDED